MRVIPKLGDHNLVVPKEVKKYVNGALEIQMTSTDLDASWERCKIVIEQVKPIEEVILHMPFSAHTFEFYMMSSEFNFRLIKLIANCIKYSTKHQIKIGLLFHAEIGIEFFNRANGKRYVEDLISLLDDTNVYFLIENAMPTLNGKDNGEVPSFELLHSIKSNKLKFCLDICHLQATENLFNSVVEIDESIAKRVYSIHFSATLNHDGFLRKSETHSRVHPSYEGVLDDLKELCDFNIDMPSVLVVAEISEYDYTLRPDMCHEIDMLYRAAKELNI